MIPDGHVGKVYRDGCLALIALKHPSGDSWRRRRGTSSLRADDAQYHVHRRPFMDPTKIYEFAAKVDVLEEVRPRRTDKVGVEAHSTMSTI